MGSIRMLRIDQTPLSVADVYASVADTPSTGGIDLFVGVVRNEDGGRGVIELDYSAHPKAETFLREVVDRAIGKYPIHAVSAVHRTGLLKVGEISVIVAVACPKTAEAFEACHEIIHGIKTSVPIWKHQRFIEGHSEWVGSESKQS
jgi:molybdopterin synthase catalytic subunit